MLSIHGAPEISQQAAALILSLGGWRQHPELKLLPQEAQGCTSPCGGWQSGGPAQGLFSGPFSSVGAQEGEGERAICMCFAYDSGPQSLLGQFEANAILLCPACLSWL